jgi:hypothetical protein
MAKRTVKQKEVVTLGNVFRQGFATNVQFTIASKLARLMPENDLQTGYDIVAKHIEAGNIVQCEVAGIFPGVPVYRIANPQAPALI